MISWDDKAKKMANSARTYSTSYGFLEDMRKGELLDGFLLTEDAFQQIVGEVASDPKVATEINDNGMLIALKADRGQELGGILEMAESFANG